MLRIKKILQELGIKPSELSKKMGVPKQFINGILQGHKGINLSTLKRIGKALNVPCSYLLKDYEENICPHCGKKLSEKLRVKK